MSRIATRKKAFAEARTELTRKGYVAYPVTHDKCTYLMAQKPGQPDRIYAVKGSSHVSGLVVTGSEHEATGHFDVNLAKAAAHHNAEPYVIAVNTHVEAIGQQPQSAYRMAVLAGERRYLAADPRRTHCLYAHGPADMQAVS